MAVLTNYARSAMCNALVDLVDVAVTAGTLDIQNSSNDTLVEIDLNDPAYGDAAAGVATADVTPVPTGSPVQTGTADHAVLKDGDGTEIFSSLTVGVGSGDVQITSLIIQVGVDVELTTSTITVPVS